MFTVLLALIDEPGDKEKFAHIYSGYKEKMYREAMSILRSHSLAEDAVQESLFRIAKSISGFDLDKENRTAALLLIIVRNVSLNMLKKEHTDEKIPLDENIGDISSDVLSKAVSDDGYRGLMSAVRDLDSIYADILILRIVYGYSSEEISEMLNIPKRTAETRFYRGKKILKEKLEGRYGQ